MPDQKEESNSYKQNNDEKSCFQLENYTNTLNTTFLIFSCNTNNHDNSSMDRNNDKLNCILECKFDSEKLEKEEQEAPQSDIAEESSGAELTSAVGKNSTEQAAEEYPRQTSNQRQQLVKIIVQRVNKEPIPSIDKGLKESCSTENIEPSEDLFEESSECEETETESTLSDNSALNPGSTCSLLPDDTVESEHLPETPGSDGANPFPYTPGNHRPTESDNLPESPVGNNFIYLSEPSPNSPGTPNSDLVSVHSRRSSLTLHHNHSNEKEENSLHPQEFMLNLNSTSEQLQCSPIAPGHHNINILLPDEPTESAYSSEPQRSDSANLSTPTPETRIPNSDLYEPPLKLDDLQSPHIFSHPLQEPGRANKPTECNYSSELIETGSASPFLDIPGSGKPTESDYSSEGSGSDSANHFQPPSLDIPGTPDSDLFSVHSQKGSTILTPQPNEDNLQSSPENSETLTISRQCTHAPPPREKPNGDLQSECSNHQPEPSLSNVGIEDPQASNISPNFFSIQPERVDKPTKSSLSSELPVTDSANSIRDGPKNGEPTESHYLPEPSGSDSANQYKPPSLDTPETPDSDLHFYPQQCVGSTILTPQPTCSDEDSLQSQELKSNSENINVSGFCAEKPNGGDLHLGKSECLIHHSEPHPSNFASANPLAFNTSPNVSSQERDEDNKPTECDHSCEIPDSGIEPTHSSGDILQSQELKSSSEETENASVHCTFVPPATDKPDGGLQLGNSEHLNRHSEPPRSNIGLENPQAPNISPNSFSIPSQEPQRANYCEQKDLHSDDVEDLTVSQSPQKKRTDFQSQASGLQPHSNLLVHDAIDATSQQFHTTLGHMNILLPTELDHLPEPQGSGSANLSIPIPDTPPASDLVSVHIFLTPQPTHSNEDSLQSQESKSITKATTGNCILVSSPREKPDNDLSLVKPDCSNHHSEPQSSIPLENPQALNSSSKEPQRANRIQMDLHPDNSESNINCPEVLLSGVNLVQQSPHSTKATDFQSQVSEVQPHCTDVLVHDDSDSTSQQFQCPTITSCANLSLHDEPTESNHSLQLPGTDSANTFAETLGNGEPPESDNSPEPPGSDNADLPTISFPDTLGAPDSDHSQPSLGVTNRTPQPTHSNECSMQSQKLKSNPENIIVCEQCILIPPYSKKLDGDLKSKYLNHYLEPPHSNIHLDNLQAPHVSSTFSSIPLQEPETANKPAECDHSHEIPQTDNANSLPDAPGSDEHTESDYSPECSGSDSANQFQLPPLETPETSVSENVSVHFQQSIGSSVLTPQPIHSHEDCSQLQELNSNSEESDNDVTVCRQYTLVPPLREKPDDDLQLRKSECVQLPLGLKNCQAPNSSPNPSSIPTQEPERVNKLTESNHSPQLPETENLLQSQELSINLGEAVNITIPSTLISPPREKSDDLKSRCLDYYPELPQSNTGCESPQASEKSDKSDYSHELPETDSPNHSADAATESDYSPEHPGSDSTNQCKPPPLDTPETPGSDLGRIHSQQSVGSTLLTPQPTSANGDRLQAKELKSNPEVCENVISVHCTLVPLPREKPDYEWHLRKSECSNHHSEPTQANIGLENPQLLNNSPNSFSVQSQELERANKCIKSNYSNPFLDASENDEPTESDYIPEHPGNDSANQSLDIPEISDPDLGIVHSQGSIGASLFTSQPNEGSIQLQELKSNPEKNENVIVSGPSTLVLPLREMPDDDLHLGKYECLSHHPEPCLSNIALGNPQAFNFSPNISFQESDKDNRPTESRDSSIQPTDSSEDNFQSQKLMASPEKTEYVSWHCTLISPPRENPDDDLHLGKSECSSHHSDPPGLENPQTPNITPNHFNIPLQNQPRKANCRQRDVYPDVENINCRKVLSGVCLVQQSPQSKKGANCCSQPSKAQAHIYVLMHDDVDSTSQQFEYSAITSGHNYILLPDESSHFPDPQESGNQFIPIPMPGSVHSLRGFTNLTPQPTYSNEDGFLSQKVKSNPDNDTSVSGQCTLVPPLIEKLDDDLYLRKSGRLNYNSELPQSNIGLENSNISPNSSTTSTQEPERATDSDCSHEVPETDSAISFPNAAIESDYSSEHPGSDSANQCKLLSLDTPETLSIGSTLLTPQPNELSLQLRELKSNHENIGQCTLVPPPREKPDGNSYLRKSGCLNYHSQPDLRLDSGKDTNCSEVLHSSVNLVSQSPEFTKGADFQSQASEDLLNDSTLQQFHCSSFTPGNANSTDISLPDGPTEFYHSSEPLGGDNANLSLLIFYTFGMADSDLVSAVHSQRGSTIPTPQPTHSNEGSIQLHELKSNHEQTVNATVSGQRILVPPPSEMPDDDLRLRKSGCSNNCPELHKCNTGNVSPNSFSTPTQEPERANKSTKSDYSHELPETDSANHFPDGATESDYSPEYPGSDGANQCKPPSLDTPGSDLGSVHSQQSVGSTFLKERENVQTNNPQAPNSSPNSFSILSQEPEAANKRTESNHSPRLPETDCANPVIDAPENDEHTESDYSSEHPGSSSAHQYKPQYLDTPETPDSDLGIASSQGSIRTTLLTPQPNEGSIQLQELKSNREENENVIVSGPCTLVVPLREMPDDLHLGCLSHHPEPCLSTNIPQASNFSPNISFQESDKDNSPTESDHSCEVPDSGIQPTHSSEGNFQSQELMASPEETDVSWHSTLISPPRENPDDDLHLGKSECSSHCSDPPQSNNGLENPQAPNVSPNRFSIPLQVPLKANWVVYPDVEDIICQDVLVSGISLVQQLPQFKKVGGCWSQASEVRPYTDVLVRDDLDSTLQRFQCSDNFSPPDEPTEYDHSPYPPGSNSANVSLPIPDISAMPDLDLSSIQLQQSILLTPHPNEDSLHPHDFKSDPLIDIENVTVSGKFTPSCRKKLDDEGKSECLSHHSEPLQSSIGLEYSQAPSNSFTIFLQEPQSVHKFTECDHLFELSGTESANPCPDASGNGELTKSNYSPEHPGSVSAKSFPNVPIPDSDLVSIQSLPSLQSQELKSNSENVTVFWRCKVFPQSNAKSDGDYYLRNSECLHNHFELHDPQLSSLPSKESDEANLISMYCREILSSGDNLLLQLPQLLIFILKHPKFDHTLMFSCTQMLISLHTNYSGLFSLQTIVMFHNMCMAPFHIHLSILSTLCSILIFCYHLRGKTASVPCSLLTRWSLHGVLVATIICLKSQPSIDSPRIFYLYQGIYSSEPPLSEERFLKPFDLTLRSKDIFQQSHQFSSLCSIEKMKYSPQSYFTLESKFDDRDHRSSFIPQNKVFFCQSKYFGAQCKSVLQHPESETPSVIMLKYLSEGYEDIREAHYSNSRGSGMSRPRRSDREVSIKPFVAIFGEVDNDPGELTSMDNPHDPIQEQIPLYHLEAANSNSDSNDSPQSQGELVTRYRPNQVILQRPTESNARGVPPQNMEGLTFYFMKNMNRAPVDRVVVYI